MALFITTLPLTCHDEYLQITRILTWCEEKWGIVDNSIWRFTDDIKRGEMIFEFISNEMKTEFLLTWG